MAKRPKDPIEINKIRATIFDKLNQKPHPKGWGMLWSAFPRNPGFCEFRNHLIFVVPVPLIYMIEALLSVFPEIP
jgi:hypothetical protein